MELKNFVEQNINKPTSQLLFEHGFNYDDKARIFYCGDIKNGVRIKFREDGSYAVIEDIDDPYYSYEEEIKSQEKMICWLFFYFH